MICEFSEGCIFFERYEGLSNTIQAVQRAFCNSEEKTICARYRVRQALDCPVPDDLLPFDHISAELLIREDGAPT